VTGFAQKSGQPPHYWPRGWLPWPIWGGRTVPVGFEGGPATPKRLKKQNKKKKVRGFEGGQTTPKGLEPLLDRLYGVVETTPRPLGVVRPPPKGQKIKKGLSFGG
jgi:hypothetical protein